MIMRCIHLVSEMPTGTVEKTSGDNAKTKLLEKVISLLPYASVFETKDQNVYFINRKPEWSMYLNVSVVNLKIKLLYDVQEESLTDTRFNLSSVDNF